LLALAVVLACVLGLGVYLSAPRPSDHDQIVAQMQRLQAAARSKSVSGIMQEVSVSYHDESLCNNIDQLHFLLIRCVNNAASIDTDVSPGTITINGDTATSMMQVTARPEAGGMAQGNILLHWRKEPSHRLLILPDTVWQVVSADYQTDFSGAY
jgi:hypothetical protein